MRIGKYPVDLVYSKNVNSSSVVKISVALKVGPWIVVLMAANKFLISVLKSARLSFHSDFFIIQNIESEKFQSQVYILFDKLFKGMVLKKRHILYPCRSTLNVFPLMWAVIR